MRYSILFCVLVVLFQGCIASHRVNSRKTIVYEIFDSLEHYFSEDIALHDQRPLGVIIDPYCPNCRISFKSEHNLFGIALVYKSSEYQLKVMFGKKGRYFKIHDELYPLYILWIDDAFVSLYGTNSSYSRGKPSKYERPYPLLDFQNFISVDLTEKTFIDDNGRKRGKVK